jgi:tetratricopeptide (TPR) repeat protein
MNLFGNFVLLVGLTASVAIAQSSSDLETAVRAFQAQNYVEASQQFDTLYRESSDDKQRHFAGFYLAEIKWRLGEIDEATRLFDEADEWANQTLEPDSQLDSLRQSLGQAQVRIARHEINASRIDDALRRAERVAKKTQSKSVRCVAMLLLGAIFSDHKNDPARGLRYFDEVAASPDATIPEKAIAIYGRARVLAELNRKDEAIALIEATLSDSNYVSMESNLLLLQGAICLDDDRVEKCSAIVERLSKSGSSNEIVDQILLLSAKIALSQGNREQAVRDWTEIVNNHSGKPSATTARIELALYQISQSDDASAIILLDAASKQNPTKEQRATIFCERGSIWLRRGKLDDAKKDLEAALADVSNAQQEQRIRFHLSETLYRLEAWREANEHWEWLLALTGTDEQSSDWRIAVQIHQAEYFAHQYRWDDTAELASKVNDAHPDSRFQGEIDYLLGRCALSKADMELARQYFSKVIESPRSKLTELAARAQWMIGESYLLQKKVDEALDAYTSVLSHYDFDEWKAAAITQSGKCYELRGQLTEAANLYGQVAAQFADTSYADIARSRMSELKLAKQGGRKTQK